MNRNYELMFILRPDLADEESDKLIGGLQAAATQAGMTVRNVERMGRRRLAYRIGSFRDGNYTLFQLESAPEAIHELERRLRVTEPVLKFLTVRTTESERRLSKARHRREKRMKRRPPAPVAVIAPATAPESPESEQPGA
jgi:small subunit ribosomal protein S6